MLESQRYSEIKLRNPTQEVCNNIATLLIKYQETSASKALVRYINDINPVQKRIESLTDHNRYLSERIRILEQVNKTLTNDLNLIRSAYENFHILITGDRNSS